MTTGTTAQADRTASARQFPRVSPSPWVALGVFLAYVALVNGIQFASGVSYSEFFATPGNAMRSAVASLAAGCLLLLTFAAWSGWEGLWRDAERLPMTRLMWVAPVAMVFFLVTRLVVKLSVGVPLDLLGAIVLAGIGVGVAEELLFRGIVLRSLRTYGRSEAHAMLLSSLWFGGMHLTNALLGTPWYAAVLQACIASVSGATLYMCRRSTGLIVTGMAVHGLWDISVFLPTGGSAAATDSFELVAVAIMLTVGLVSASAVFVDDRARRM